MAWHEKNKVSTEDKSIRSTIDRHKPLHGLWLELNLRKQYQVKLWTSKFSEKEIHWNKLHTQLKFSHHYCRYSLKFCWLSCFLLPRLTIGKTWKLFKVFSIYWISKSYVMLFMWLSQSYTYSVVRMGVICSGN